MSCAFEGSLARLAWGERSGVQGRCFEVREIERTIRSWKHRRFEEGKVRIKKKKDGEI